jgi:hypothetical protein
MNANGSGGIVCDGRVLEGKAERADKGGTAMVGGVPLDICEDPHEGMGSPELVIGNLHQDGE